MFDCLEQCFSLNTALHLRLVFLLSQAASTLRRHPLCEHLAWRHERFNVEELPG